MNNAIQRAIERAKRLVVATGRSNVFAHVCRERGEFGREEVFVMSNAEYQEHGNEDSCIASVWRLRGRRL